MLISDQVYEHNKGQLEHLEKQGVALVEPVQAGEVLPDTIWLAGAKAPPTPTVDVDAEKTAQAGIDAASKADSVRVEDISESAVPPVSTPGSDDVASEETLQPESVPAPEAQTEAAASTPTAQPVRQQQQPQHHRQGKKWGR